MKRILFFFVLVFLTLSAYNQSLISGVVRDANSGEELIGANVVVGPSTGTITDLNGHFSLNVIPGKYNLQVSYVGYISETREVEVSAKPVFLDFALKTMIIDEVVVTADMAIERETPVAFSNVSPAQIQEELAGRDLPMILNTTPGVYATQQGGGDGDARITIRGVDQSNVAVMIDGIPVNDMENGWVYWSNWFGLDLVTRTMQVQRGLGASQLALPSVGGTINILTKGIDNSQMFSFKQEMTSELRTRTSVAYSSGKLANGWGITLAASYKRGEGWVDHTFSEGAFYYLKIDKRLGNHLLSVTGMGAPQYHYQRLYGRPVTAYDSTYASNLGVDINALQNYTSNYNIFNKGLQYNQHWGVLQRDRYNSDAPLEILSERTNVYYKPQYTLRDYWSVNDRLSFSTNLYISLGYGGGIRPNTSIKDTQIIDDPDDPYYGQIDWQSIYNANCKKRPGLGGYPIITTYSDSLFVSSNYMINAHNEHVWYGLLEKFNFKANENFDLSGGIDARSYNGIHYATIVDLLGGDYAVDKSDTRVNYQANPKAAMKYVGDTVNYYYEGRVRWGGLFVQGEYHKDNFSSFMTLTGAFSFYKKIDYFLNSESDWVYKPGFTIKTGANYNLNTTSNIFLNVGWLSRAKAFKYMYNTSGTSLVANSDNEDIRAIEAGYTYNSRRFSAKTNLYYTYWGNKPVGTLYTKYFDPVTEDEIDVTGNITGLDSRYEGIEIDFAYKILRNLELQGTLSICDWIWNSLSDSIPLFNADNSNELVGYTQIDARGIHVGNAAQNQIGTSLRYEPIKGFYVSLRQTLNAKYYSDFSIANTTDMDGNVQDSWRLPNFNLFDLHMGYQFDIMNKYNVSLKLSVINLLNTEYIWDATNNDGYGPYASFYQDFDATSATVFFGTGRTVNAMLLVSF